MSILINNNTKVIVQGITGKEAQFHTVQCIEYGTNIVGGVTPGKGGTSSLNLPVYNTLIEAKTATGADASIIFVPASHAADAIMEAAHAGIKLIVCITEGIPAHDMILVKEFLKQTDSLLLGPNCPGIISSGMAKLGIMPGFVFKKGSVGLISKSGTLTYEAANQIVDAGFGISTAIGIGGDPIIGLSFVDCLKLFEKDDGTQACVIIGEIGGDMEIELAEYISKSNYSKPVVAFIAGQTAPKGKKMGHAGAIISEKSGSASSKIKALENAGVAVAKSPAKIGTKLKSVLK